MTAGNYPLGLEHCFKALALAKKMNIREAVAYCKMLFAECYYNPGDYDTSLHYLRQLLTVAYQKCPSCVYRYWITESRIFEGMHQHYSALLYAQKAYADMKRDTMLKAANFDTQVQLSLFATLLSNAFRGKAVYDSALYYYRAGIP